VSRADQTLTVSQAARLLGLSGFQVRRLAKIGELPAQTTRLGRTFRAEDVYRLKQQREAAAPPRQEGNP
jgi:excisionase family DNA binding protein